MVNLPVLVLNQNYEPLNVCRARRALVLILHGKAEMLENGSGYIYTTTSSFPLPSVIRLIYLIRRPRPLRKLTRLEVFHRDRYTCQYCGKYTHDLTIDHVIPQRLGRQHTWDNVVSACIPCNRRKAGKTLHKARMQLLREPGPPSGNLPFYIPLHYLEDQMEWQKYLPQ